MGALPVLDELDEVRVTPSELRLYGFEVEEELEDVGRIQDEAQARGAGRHRDEEQDDTSRAAAPLADST